MNTFRLVLFAAVCLAVLLAPSAAAQALPFSLSTYQGNGQMIGSSACFGPDQYIEQFQPLVVKVVDANGNLAPDGTAVSWSMQLGNGNLGSSQTTTKNGLASTTYLNSVVSGSPSTPIIQSTIVATLASSTATFYETQELGQVGTGVCSSRFSITPQVPISGAAGSQAAPIQVVVSDPNIGGIPNVEVQLVNSQSSPSVSCLTGSGADPGTVLTDAYGNATCTPVLAGSGTGIFLILVGGVADNPQAPPPCNEQFADGGGAAGFGTSSSCLSLKVTAPTVGSIQVSGGNYQSAYAGQTLSRMLTAVVKDTNGNTLQGVTVNWTVSPATAGTFTNTAATVSDSSGQVANGFTLSSSANGNITITAAVANTSFQAVFSATAMVLVSPQYLQKISGDSPVQTAASGQAFPNPLVVQVNLSNGQPASGITVSFTISGPAAVANNSSSSPQTDNSGRASVSLVALSTTSQATVTVTASVAGLTPVTFQLIVIPPGPVITANSFVNAADLKVGSLSPCSIATVTGNGIAPNIQGTILGATFGPAPTNLQGDSISFPANGTSIQAPLFSIANNGGTQSLTFQVPCEVSGGSVLSVVVSVGGGSATVNLPILAASPGVYGAVGTDGVTRALLARPDGSFVSLANPARRGETVTAFVNGLGPTTPQVGTNQLPPRGTVATVNGTVVPGVAGGGAALYSQPQLAADLVGIYEVSFVIPSNVNSGNNVGFSIGLIPVGASTAQYSALMYIPIGQ